MAIYHLSVKTISRSAGRSATGAAAYRSGTEIVDERTGEVHDYTRKGGVEYSQIVLPADSPEWATDRAALWNAAEQAETRKNSTVAREFEIALPSDLSYDERQRLAVDFAKEIVERHGCAADIAIHAPGKGGDNRNHHAHILCSTRRLTPEGFTQKTRELDERKSGEVDRWRERFAELQNERFHENGIDAQVDHRSLKAQGIDREPTEHLGVAATGYERRTGQASDKRLAFEREAAERLARAKEIGEMEQEAKELESAIINLSSNLSEAKEPERAKLNRELAKAVAGADIKGVEKPIEPVLRQEERIVPPKPELSPVELAEAEKGRFFEEARMAWRKQEEAALLLEAEKARQDAWKIKAQEPEKPFFGLLATSTWKDDIAQWERELQRKIDLHDALTKQAQTTVAGESREEEWQSNTFHAKARQRLEKERPELAQALEEKRQAEQRKAKEAAIADKAINALKTQAFMREKKAFGYGDDGKKWNALPENLKTMIEGLNKQPEAARALVLARIHKNIKQEPGAAERLLDEIEQAKGRSRDNGMGR